MKTLLPSGVVALVSNSIIALGLFASTLGSPASSEEFVHFGGPVTLAQMERVHIEMACWSKHGHWVLNDSMILGTDLAHYSPCPMHYGRRNPCRLQLESQSLRYYWTTGAGNCTSSPLAPFSARGFCDTLLRDHGSLLVVGDSVSELSATSWRNQFLLGLGAAHCPASPLLPSCHGRGLYAARNDRLSLLAANVSRFESTSESHHGHKFMEFAWLHQIEALNVSLLVLSRGLQYENDTKLLHDVNETISYLHRRFPHIGVVWRNSAWAHGVPDFQMHGKTPPLHTPLAPTTPPPPATTATTTAPAPAEDPDPHHHQHQHQHQQQQHQHQQQQQQQQHTLPASIVAHQNALVDALLQAHHPHVLRLDAATPSALRIDAHGDATHPCVPGSADTWLMLLYSALLRLHSG